MKNKYPYIQGDKVNISPKFIGETERSIPLNHVQQLMSSLEIGAALQDLTTLINDSKNVFNQYVQENIKGVHPRDVVNELSFLQKEVDRLYNKVKPFLA